MLADGKTLVMFLKVVNFIMNYQSPEFTDTEFFPQNFHFHSRLKIA